MSLVFHCSPEGFLNMPAAMLDRIADRTAARLEERARLQAEGREG